MNNHERKNLMPLPNATLPNARRIATARAALTTAIAVRSDFPIVSDVAVIELLADLRHFCAARNIDFAACNDVAQEHFRHEMDGGRR
jgi:hypothetical protein